MKQHKWFWITLFVLAVSLTVGLATSWNVAFVLNPRFPNVPWVTLVIGTLGFIAVVAATVLLFIRLLIEMRLNTMQSEFLAKISHELKSPITSLELTASLLKKDSVSNKDNDKLWELHQGELKRLKTEVDLILETSRWDAKPYKPEPICIRLDDWLNNSKERWLAILGQGASLTVNNGFNNSHAMIDPRLLDLITDNLVDNSRKFAIEKPHLTVTTQTAVKNGDNRWEIVFSDQGWGFDPRNTNKIFKRFYRAETYAPRAIAGTGLGLYLAREAGKRLGMTLKAESKGPGKGARFTLEGALL
jgi:signal transduction histidine kinase